MKNSTLSGEVLRHCSLLYRTSLFCCLFFVTSFAAGAQSFAENPAAPLLQDLPAGALSVSDVTVHAPIGYEVTTAAGAEHAFAVSISQHPVAATTCENSTAAFSVAATGSGTLTYQWQVSTNGGSTWSNIPAGAPYSGTNTASLNITGVPFSFNTFQYRCQVNDGTTPVASNAALLTVNRLVISTAGGIATVCPGGSSSMTLSSSVSSYQWYVSTDNGTIWSALNNGGNYSGVTAAMLSVSGVTLAMDNYRYRCIATDAVTGCSATSGSYLLDVIPMATFNQSPATTSVCPGTPATFTIDVADASSVKWQFSTDGSTWNDLVADNATYSGTGTNNLTVSGTNSTMNNYRYRVLGYNSLGCATTSGIGILTIKTLPAISTQPTNRSICATTNTSFVVGASGSGVTYRWQTDNGTNGATWTNTGVTTLNQPITAATMAMNGWRYRVIITADCGTLTSAEATLTVRSSGTWLGTVNTDWHVAGNWCGGVPTSTTDVLIPNVAPRMPEISHDIAYSRSLTIENTAKLTISSGQTAMSGPFDIQGTVAYTNNGDQPILPAPHGSLEVNGSGNKYMISHVPISHNLVLGGSAKLVTSQYLITMKAGSNAISGATFNGTPTSWIVTGNGNSGAGNTGLGGVRIEQIGTASGTTLFPVGPTPSSYNPMQIANTGVTDNFTVAVNDLVIPGGIYSSGINRTWLLSEATPGGSLIAMDVKWQGPEEQAQFNRTLTEIIRSNGTYIVENSSTAPAAGTGPYYRTAGSFTTLTQFSVASYVMILPVKLRSFTAQKTSTSTANVNWNTDPEGIAATYEVQKSQDGVYYTTSAQLPGITGKTNYVFTDNKLGNGITYYRLRMTGKQGEVLFSRSAQVVNKGNNTNSVSLRPSITTGTTNLLLTLEKGDHISVTITDIAGRVQARQTWWLQKGEYLQALPVMQLPKGVYYVRVAGEQTNATILPLVKQ